MLRHVFFLKGSLIEVSWNDGSTGSFFFEIDRRCGGNGKLTSLVVRLRSLGLCFKIGGKCWCFFWNRNSGWWLIWIDKFALGNFMAKNTRRFARWKNRKIMIQSSNVWSSILYFHASFWGWKTHEKTHQQEIYEVIYQVGSIDKCPDIFVDSTCKGWWKSAHESMNAIHLNPRIATEYFNIFQSKILLKSQEVHPIAATLTAIKILSGNSMSHIHIFQIPMVGFIPRFWVCVSEKSGLRINFLRFQRGKSHQVLLAVWLWHGNQMFLSHFF